MNGWIMCTHGWGLRLRTRSIQTYISDTDILGDQQIVTVLSHAASFYLLEVLVSP